MTLTTRVLEFIQNAQPGDALALSTDACCEMRQGIWLQAERSLARRDLFIYCQNEVPRVVRHGGAGEVLRTAGAFAASTGRELER
jgi:hypothetical protein